MDGQTDAGQSDPYMSLLLSAGNTIKCHYQKSVTIGETDKTLYKCVWSTKTSLFCQDDFLFWVTHPLIHASHFHSSFWPSFLNPTHTKWNHRPQASQLTDSSSLHFGLSTQIWLHLPHKYTFKFVLRAFLHFLFFCFCFDLVGADAMPHVPVGTAVLLL